MITEFILEKCPDIKMEPEITPGDHGFSMITSGGVETEVGEFIYSLIRIMKPTLVLETGTHMGLSASYIGLALKKNGKGKMVTLDIIMYDQAKKQMEQLGLTEIVERRQCPSLEYVPEGDIDVLFLDSEPCYRFQEFVRFFDLVIPGGIIMIHDLHPHLSYAPIHTITPHWPYGDFRETIGPYIASHDVQTLSFPTPRGFTVFQKRRDDFSSTKLLRKEI